MRNPILLLALATGLVAGQGSARVLDADVIRNDPDTVTLSWSDPDPVAIYEADRADFALTDAHRLAQSARGGQFAVAHAGVVRHYFALVDLRDHHRVDVAERLIPLAQGSNFRDIGGYVGAGGKRVRWGLIYRSGATPLLTEADVAMVHTLGVTQMVDLRSDEERMVAPTKINGVPYAAVGYGLTDLVRSAGPGPIHNGADLYRNFPQLLAPQLKIVFAHLLHDKTPLVYNCSAGQDRTGFVTAMILTALGVPQATIVADYHLSTRYRRPEFEMPPFDPALATTHPGLQIFAGYRTRPGWNVAQPLMDKDGQPFLRGAFDAIRDKWGSVDAYLQAEAGVGPAQIAQLRSEYLE